MGNGRNYVSYFFFENSDEKLVVVYVTERTGKIGIQVGGIPEEVGN